MAKKRKRADYGAGSVYQESDGSWRVAIRLKEGEKPIRRRAPDRASAERLLAELRAQRDAGLDVRKGFQALEDFTDYWFNEVYLQRGNSERADKHTLDMLELHILPQLGKLALTAIDHARLQQFINDLRRRPNKAPLAPQTVHHVYSVLKQVFGKAVAMNVLSRDPTLNLELPEIQPADRPLLETTQIRALLDFVTNHPHGFAYHAMAVLGLRLGEALALRRIDFNQDFTEVTINQQISYHSRKLIAPKRQSIRLLAVPPMLAAVAAAQWQRVLAIHGTDFASGGLMSPSEAGTPIQPSNFEKTWRGHTQRRILKAGPKAYVHAGIRAGAGLPASATLHDLRRHLATILADLDTAQRTIGLILGHGAKNVTERYIRRMLPTMRRALERFEALVWGEEQQREGVG